MRRSFVLLILLAAALTTACGQAASLPSAITLTDPTPLPTAVDAVTDSASLAEALRASGADVALEGDVSQTFLNTHGAILRVNDQRLQVYEYADNDDARADAARFSADGAWVNSDIGATLVNWVATPHLYQASRLIAVYVGDHQPMLALLEDVLGAPFAGGANPYHPYQILRTAS